MTITAKAYSLPSAVISLILVIVLITGSCMEASAATYEGADVSHNSSSGKPYTWKSVMNLTYSTQDNKVDFTGTVIHKNTTSGGSLGEIGKYTDAKLTRKIGSGTETTVSTYTHTAQGYMLESGDSKTLISSKSFSVDRKCSAQSVVVKGSVTVNSSSAWTGTSTATSSSVSIPALKRYTIKYNANGGSGAPATNSGTCTACGSSDASSHKGKSHGKPFKLSTKVPTRTGYAFKNWNTKQDGSGTTYTPGYECEANNDLVLYAQWRTIRYTVVFDPNADDVSGTMPSQTMEENKPAYLIRSNYFRPGYRLKGWSLSRNGSIVSTDGGQVKDLGKPGTTVTLYAIWEAISMTQAEIVVGKTVTAASGSDSFDFVIEAVRGWTHENETTTASGKMIHAEDMPMPEGTQAGSTQKVITIDGLQGNTNVLVTRSIGLITFDAPGWYMYRLYEKLPANPDPAMKYDATSYYAVVYVAYQSESDNKIEVRNITAWHNNAGSDRNIPDLSDITSGTDNKGNPASANDQPGVFGKTGIGKNSLAAYKFWNARQTGTFRIVKNVKGSLGDISKEFEFDAVFQNMSPSTTYAVKNDGAILGDGFSGDSFITDAEGNAVLSFKLNDNAGFEFDGLPPGCKFEITEKKSDHYPGYSVSTTSSQIAEDKKYLHTPLSTGVIEVSGSDTYTVVFTNERELTPVTGIVPAMILPSAIFLMIPAGVLFYRTVSRRHSRNHLRCGRYNGQNTPE